MPKAVNHVAVTVTDIQKAMKWYRDVMGMTVLATHSNGTTVYICKNCNYGGTMESFTEPFHASQILQQH